MMKFEEDNRTTDKWVTSFKKKDPKIRELEEKNQELKEIEYFNQLEIAKLKEDIQALQKEYREYKQAVADMGLAECTEILRLRKLLHYACHAPELFIALYQAENEPWKPSCAQTAEKRV